MKKIKKGIKFVLGYIFLLLVGIWYILKSIFIFIDTNVPKLFMKAPRIIRQFVIYSMIILSACCFMGRDNKSVYVPRKIEPVLKVKALELNHDFVEEPKSECDMLGIECGIYYESLEQGLTKNQAYMVMAISKQETGHWSSAAFKELNNIGGIMGSNGLRSYDSLDKGITDMVSILKNYYFDKGLDTLEKIQKKYCPIGAKNDPTGLNNYWLKNTTIFLNEYLGGK